MLHRWGRRVSGGALAGRAWGGAGLRVSGAREFGPVRGWAMGWERAQSEKREVRAEGVGRARAEGGLVG